MSLEKLISTIHTEPLQHDIKVIFLGDCGVGKSCLIHRMMFHNFPDHATATIGAAFFRYNGFEVDGKTIPLSIWDTAGAERYHSLLPLYIRDCQIAICCMEIDGDLRRIDNFASLIEEHSRSADDSPARMVVIVTKMDLVKDEALKMSVISKLETKGYECLCTSAQNGEGMSEMLKCLRICAVGVVEKRFRQQNMHFPDDMITLVDMEDAPKESHCCS